MMRNTTKKDLLLLIFRNTVGKNVIKRGERRRRRRKREERGCWLMRGTSRNAARREELPVRAEGSVSARP
jgi:hypothetical protein